MTSDRWSEMMVGDNQPTAAAVDCDRLHFTPERANRALPYVKRIVRDVRQAYRHAVALQHRLEMPTPDEDTALLGRQYEALMTQLNEYLDELQLVGVELKDYELGLVDFPAVFQGREICLCWKYGEPQVHTWHELDDGFSGRQSVDQLKTRPVA